MKSMLKYLEIASIALKIMDNIIFHVRSGDIKDRQLFVGEEM